MSKRCTKWWCNKSQLCRVRGVESGGVIGHNSGVRRVASGSEIVSGSVSGHSCRVRGGVGGAIISHSSRVKGGDSGNVITHS